MNPSGKKPDPLRDNVEAEPTDVDPVDHADAVRGIRAGIADVDAGR